MTTWLPFKYPGRAAWLAWSLLLPVSVPIAGADANAPATLLNLQFAAEPGSGLAAFGIGNHDVWNPIGQGAERTTSGLLEWDGSPSPLTATVHNLPHLRETGASDTLLSTFASGDAWDLHARPVPASLVLSNLQSGVYDVVCYGIGSNPTLEYAGFSLSWSTNSTAIQWTHPGLAGSDLDAEPWTEGLQFVVFNNLTIRAGDVLTVALHPNASSTYAINGLQLIRRPLPAEALPPVVLSPGSGAWVPLQLEMSVPGHPGASIHFTTDGNPPGLDSPLYSGPIALENPCIVQAFAWREGFGPSPIVAARYRSPDSDGDGLTDYQEKRLGTDPARTDTDFDGRTDSQESADRTNPLDPHKVLPLRLARFGFDSAQWLGDSGQTPLAALHLANPSGWKGKALRLLPGNSARLQYRDIEPAGTGNMHRSLGSLRFWFKPDWSSAVLGGTGPQSQACLIELGRSCAGAPGGSWTLAFNPDGTRIVFAQANGSPERWIDAPALLQSNRWHQIVLTYSPSGSALFLNGKPIASGAGVSPGSPDADPGVCGFHIGSDSQGGSPARGLFDELETFNHPLDPEIIRRDYNQIASRDSDGDGIGDLREQEIGSNRLASDLPYRVRITRPSPGSILP